MKEEDFSDLISRIKDSTTPPELKKELTVVLHMWRQHFRDIHACTTRKSVTGPHFISGIALGKDGFTPGDMGA